VEPRRESNGPLHYGAHQEDIVEGAENRRKSHADRQDGRDRRKRRDSVRDTLRGGMN